MGYAASAAVYHYPGNAPVHVRDCRCHCHQYHQSVVSEGEVRQVAQNQLKTIFMTHLPGRTPYVSVRVVLCEGTTLFGKTVQVEQDRELMLEELPEELQYELLAVWCRVEEAIK
jgi:hypothetical protein